MSSHHIVKDKQEPALIIANGEACSSELLGQLLEWSPFIVVLDNAIYRVMELGIKVDVWLGDFDESHDFAKVQEQQFPIEIVRMVDQEKTDLEKGIDFLVGRGFPAVNIVWATGRRADHTITNITNLIRYKDVIRTVLIDDHSKIFPMTGIFKKWYAKGTPLSLIPVGTAEGVQTENLEYNLFDEALVLGRRTGSSNLVAADGIVSISIRSGDMLIMECWD